MDTDITAKVSYIFAYFERYFLLGCELIILKNFNDISLGFHIESLLEKNP